MNRFIRAMLKTEDGSTVVFQRPNLPIVLCVAFYLFAQLPIPHAYYVLFLSISALSLTTWAMLEVATGVNMFRRFLGAITLLGICILVYIGTF